MSSNFTAKERVSFGWMRNRILVEFVLIAAGCAVFILATYQFRLGGFMGGGAIASKLLQQLFLGHENNLAAWFSGALLVLIGFHAMDGYSFHRQSAPNVAKAWMAIAAIMIFLSADEVGSLHERMAGVGRDIGVGDWGLLLPLGLVIAVALLWAIWVLWREGNGKRVQAILLLCGFALFGSVALQEFLEHALPWNGARIIALRVAIEEGTELLGMLVLLAATMKNSMELVGDREGAPFNVLLEKRVIVLCALIAALPLTVYLNIGFEDNRLGQTVGWLAGTGFLAAAAVVLAPWLEGKAGSSTLMVAGILAAVSCGMVALDQIPSGLSLFAFSKNTALLVTLTIMALVVAHVVGLLHEHFASTLILAGLAVSMLVLGGNEIIAFSLNILLSAAVYSRFTMRQSR